LGQGEGTKLLPTSPMFELAPAQLSEMTELFGMLLPH